MKLHKQDLEYLAFLQEQMEVRRSEDENKIGRDDRCTTEYLVLTMVWQEFLKIYLGLYPALDGNIFGTGKNNEVWIEVQKYRKKR